MVFPLDNLKKLWKYGSPFFWTIGEQVQSVEKWAFPHFLTVFQVEKKKPVLLHVTKPWEKLGISQLFETKLFKICKKIISISTGFGGDFFFKYGKFHYKRDLFCGETFIFDKPNFSTKNIFTGIVDNDNMQQKTCDFCG